MPQSQQKMDASDSAFFARELEYLKQRVWERQYPPFSAWQYFPLSTEVDPGAETIVWQEWDKVGIAKIVASYASDLPRVDVYMEENVSNIRTIGDSYGFSNQDIRSARKAGKSLSSRKAMAARQAAEQKANEIAWFGDRTNGLRGVMETENANIVVPVTAAASPNGTGWNASSGKTADEILTDLHNLYQACRTASNDVERADTILLPTDEYGYINTTRIGDTTTTILQFFRSNHQDIVTVDSVVELNDVRADRRPSDGATTAANVGMAYNRSDDKFTHEIPMMFTQHPVQDRNLEHVVPCEMRSGGVIVYRPVSISFIENI